MKKIVNVYYTVYLFMCILFIILSPQYFGAILPLMFLFPIYIGMKGMKMGSRQGFLFSISIIPMAFMTAVVWIRYGISIIFNYNESLKEMIISSGLSLNIAKFIIITFPILSFILMGLCIFQVFNAIKIRKLFV